MREREMREYRQPQVLNRHDKDDDQTAGETSWLVSLQSWRIKWKLVKVKIWGAESKVNMMVNLV